MRILIVGNGKVGNAIGTALKECGQHEVEYFDMRRKVSDYSTLGEALKKEFDFCFVCVPTDSLKDGRCDMSGFRSVVEEIGKSRSETVVVQRSTCPVGSAKRLSEEFGIDGSRYIVCPSFLYRATAVEDEKNPCKVVVGFKNRKAMGSLEGRVFELFGWIDREKFYFGSYEDAEMSKYASNNWQVVILGFWNEIFRACQRLGADNNWVMNTVIQEESLSSLERIHGKGFGKDGRMQKDAEAFIAAGGWREGALLGCALRINDEMIEEYGVQTKSTKELKEELKKIEKEKVSRALRK